jgi:short-subunit dehydrogenase
LPTSAKQTVLCVEDALRQNSAIELLVNNAGAANLAPFLASDADSHEALNTSTPRR